MFHVLCLSGETMNDFYTFFQLYVFILFFLMHFVGLTLNKVKYIL